MRISSWEQKLKASTAYKLQSLELGFLKSCKLQSLATIQTRKIHVAMQWAARRNYYTLIYHQIQGWFQHATSCESESEWLGSLVKEGLLRISGFATVPTTPYTTRKTYPLNYYRGKTYVISHFHWILRTDALSNFKCKVNTASNLH